MPAACTDYDRSRAEGLAMTRLALAAACSGIDVLDRFGESGVRTVLVAAGSWCWVAVSYPSWLENDPSAWSYQVDVTRHGDHLGSFLTGVRAEDGPRRIARMLRAVTDEKSLLRELASRHSDPAAEAARLLGNPTPAADRPDPVAALAAAAGLRPLSEPTDVLPPQALSAWMKVRSGSGPQLVVPGGRDAEQAALIVWSDRGSVVCQSFADA